MTDDKISERDRELLDTLEGIRYALFILGTGRPEGSTARGALELVAGSISGESGSLAEYTYNGLSSLSNSIDQLVDLVSTQQDATARFRRQGIDPLRRADESVREFIADWFEITGDETHRVSRSVMNELYAAWCDDNHISLPDRVTTSVLCSSLRLLGVSLVSGQPTVTRQTHRRTHAYIGIKQA
jgi:hypothetical protein